MEPQFLQLKRYLLGELDNEERADLDVKLLTDEEFAVSIELAEEDLIENYLDDLLTSDEVQRFEHHFLASAERLLQFRVSLQLREYSHGLSTQSTVDNTFFLTRFFAVFWRRPLIAAASVLALVIGIAAIYFLVGRGGPYAELQAEYATLNRQDLSNLEYYSGLASIVLMPGSTRGSGSNLKAPEGAPVSVFVRLALPIELRDDADLGVKVVRENAELLRFHPVRVYENAGGKEIRLLLPTKIFEKGNYRIEVAASGRVEAPVNYVFTLE
jgi:hypothetical protein